MCFHPINVGSIFLNPKARSWFNRYLCSFLAGTDLHPVAVVAPDAVEPGHYRKPDSLPRFDGLNVGVTALRCQKESKGPLSGRGIVLGRVSCYHKDYRVPRKTILYLPWIRQMVKLSV